VVTQVKGKEKLKLKLKTPPKQSQYKLSSLDRFYHVSSLNHPVSREFYKFCAYSLSPPFGNELIKHNPREA
jgi:hypothetical protein